jgi:hypothetical protein
MLQETIHILFKNYCQEYEHLGQIHFLHMQSITIFAFAIPSSPYTNNDDNNSNKIPTLKITFEFSNGIHVKNMGTNVGLKVMISDTIAIDSTIMTTCMPPFSNPLWNLTQYQKN